MTPTGPTISDTIDAMAKKDEPRHFTRKLARLVEGKYKTTIDAKAGLPEGAVSILLLRKSIPSPHAALKIAKALGVDYEWLVNEDDASLDPPAKTTLNIQAVRSRDLLMELLRRYYTFAESAAGLLSGLEAIHDPESDYPLEDRLEQTAVRVWRDLWQNGPEKHVFNSVDWALAADVVELSQAMIGILGFEGIDQHVGLYINTLPDEKVTFEAEELRAENLRYRWSTLRGDHPGVDSLGNYMTSKDTILAKPDPIARHMAGACLANLVMHPVTKKMKELDELRDALRKEGQINEDGKVVYFLGSPNAANIGIPPRLQKLNK